MNDVTPNADNGVLNIICGVSEDNKFRSDFDKFINLQGKHIICGGTTAKLSAQILGKEIVTSLVYEDEKIPPISEIEGIELVTEGAVTISETLEILDRFRNSGDRTFENKKDGASLLAKYLVMAKEINLFIGSSVNPANEVNPKTCMKTKIENIRNIIYMLSDMDIKVNVN